MSRFTRLTKVPSLNGQFVFSVASVNAAGSTQADAAKMTAQINVVALADGTKGVSLPNPAESGPIMVVNTVASGLKVWPIVGGGDNIDGGTVDASVTVAASTTKWFIPVSASGWRQG